LDVGGQRNERRKWIHSFEGVTSIIFVTAISEYDQNVFEDEKENRLQESIRVFDDIINNQYFKTSTIILFMNKVDLFQEKVPKVPLTVCFPDYKGGDSFDECSSFIREEFLDKNQDKGRFIFPHLTCATDTENVSRVFEACKLTIFNTNLQKIGLT